MTVDALLQVIGDRALLLALVGLLAVWIARRKPRIERAQSPSSTRSNWRRRALWFAAWWTLRG